MSKELVAVVQKQVAFYDDEITAVRVEEGSVYVPIRPICRLLGIAWGSQRNRIMRDPILAEAVRGVFVTNTPDRGGAQEMLCLPLDMMHGWLFGINATRVKEAVRAQLLRYQRECYRVLSKAFLDDEVTHRPESVDIDKMLQHGDTPSAIAYRHAMAIVNLARQQAILEIEIDNNRTRIDSAETRLDAIEAELGNPERYVTGSQAAEISESVKLIAGELGKASGRNEYQGVYMELYRRFGITSYKKLPANKFDEAMNFLRNWFTTVTGDDSVPF